MNNYSEDTHLGFAARQKSQRNWIAIRDKKKNSVACFDEGSPTMTRLPESWAFINSLRFDTSYGIQKAYEREWGVKPGTLVDTFYQKFIPSKTFPIAIRKGEIIYLTTVNGAMSHVHSECSKPMDNKVDKVLVYLNEDINSADRQKQFWEWLDYRGFTNAGSFGQDALWPHMECLANEDRYALYAVVRGGIYLRDKEELVVSGKPYHSMWASYLQEDIKILNGDSSQEEKIRASGRLINCLMQNGFYCRGVLMSALSDCVNSYI